MGFTKALFYPTIDIENEDWLKSAVLFWDEISTIVPVSIDNPYRQNATQYLADEGILRPKIVGSGTQLVEDLAADTMNYLNTNEGFQLLTQGRSRGSVVHRDKLPREVDRLFGIHPDKLPSEIRYQLRDSLRGDGFFNVNSSFAIFYMTLLANKICERTSLALLTDDNLTSNLTDKVRLDNQVPIGGRREHDFDRFRQDERYINLAQGLLTNLVIDGIRFSQGTSLVDIVNFRKKHQDELGLFRTNVAKLTQGVSKDAPYETVRRQVEDIYKDEFLPAYNNFKMALKGAGIKWTSENFMKVSMISTGATALPMAVLGLSLPQALVAGVGVSLVTSLVSYNQDKQERLRNNPYSYLLSVDRKL